MGWSSINDNFYQGLLGYQQVGQVALGMPVGPSGTQAKSNTSSSAVNPWAGQAVDSFSSTTFPMGGGINELPDLQTLMMDPFAATSADSKQMFADIQNAVGSVTNGLGGLLTSVMSNPTNLNVNPVSTGVKADALESSSGSNKSGKKVKGKVGDWIAKAQKILKKHGVPLEKMNAEDIAIIIKHESGGNPNAKNNWDSNAAKGTPSIGLMQTIGPTFNAYKLPGHDDITDPGDNIIAGVRYAIKRYGSVSNVPGVKKVKNGEKYVGY
jgi:hypothetical protein